MLLDYSDDAVFSISCIRKEPWKSLKDVLVRTAATGSLSLCSSERRFREGIMERLWGLKERYIPDVAFSTRSDSPAFSARTR